MPLSARIEQDYRDAFKRGDRGVMAALRLLKASLKNAEIAKRGELIDAEIIAVLRRESKKRHEAMKLYHQGNRPELARKEQAELSVFEHYLPAQASPEQIQTAVKAVIAELKPNGQQDFGRVMKQAMERLGGTADGGAVSAAVKERLG